MIKNIIFITINDLHFFPFLFSYPSFFPHSDSATTKYLPLILMEVGQSTLCYFHERYSIFHRRTLYRAIPIGTPTLQLVLRPETLK